jgi:F-type H+-transporting ATPase subunit a
MSGEELAIVPVFSVGWFQVTGTVVTTWVIMAVLWIFSWMLSARLRLEPGPVQTVVEGIVLAIENAVAAVSSDHSTRIMPFIATIWIYITVANLSGLIPAVHSPTRDLSATAALAFVVFASTHWYGLRILGVRKYLSHYTRPNAILLPFHLISEVTRTIALAIRLFGNIMSLELAALLILLVAGFLAPVPILMLHVVEALIQAYIFGMLALIYVAGGLQSQVIRHKPED